MSGFNLDSLVNLGRDVQSNIEILHELGNFKVDGVKVRRVDNNQLGTHSVVFPLMKPDGTQHIKDGSPVFKYAKLRGNASLNAPEYRIYLGKLINDVKDATTGNLYTDSNGKEVGKAGDMDFYAESIGGDPRPARVAPSDAMNAEKPLF